MQEHELPTIHEMFVRSRECVHQAYGGLGDAQDWLRSDWQPLGSRLTDQQADALGEAQRLIGETKQQLYAITELLSTATEQ